jgi:hypothetical protein
MSQRGSIASSLYSSPYVSPLSLSSSVGEGVAEGMGAVGAVGAMYSPMGPLCTPALLYYVISLIGLVILAAHNLYMWTNEYYHVGKVRCKVPNCIFLFVLKFLGVLLWTWLLNAICRSGYTQLSWVLFLLPYLIALYVLSTAIMIGMASSS